MQDLSISSRMNEMPVSALHRKITVLIGIGLFFDIYDIFLAGTIGVVLAKTFQVPTILLPLLIGSSFLGMFLGSIILSSLADRIGRRKAFLTNLVIYSLFTFLGAFSMNVTILIITRFIAGIGIGAEPPLCDTYLSEILPTKVRGLYIGWAYTLSFVAIPFVGFLALGLVPLHVLGMAGWRWLFVIGSLGSVVIWFFQRSLPESPRWLESVGRIVEAEQLLTQFGAPKNDKTFENSQVAATKVRPVRVSTLFGKNYIVRTFMLWIFQILQTLGYYGFGTLVPIVLASKGFTIVHSLEFTSLSFIGYPIGSILSLFILERIQRKWIIVSAAFGMALFGLMFGLASSSTVIVFFGFLYTLVSNIFSNSYHIFQAEIFPTAIRATAAGWGYSLSRLMSGLMPFLLLPILHADGAVAMFSVVAVAMVLIMIDIGVFAPRTTGIDLETVNKTTV